MPDKPPPFHYRVECLMCVGSLIAESDNLEELFRIVRDHLRHEQDKKETDHKMKKNEVILRDLLSSPAERDPHKNPPTNRQIFESKGFLWSVDNMVPFKVIRERVQKDIDDVLKTDYSVQPWNFTNR